jgi:hypothetical protein
MTNFRKIFDFGLLKKTFFILGIILIFFVGFVFFDNRLLIFEANIIWPQKSFDEVIFKNGNADARASMVADLIAKKKYIGSECKNIPEFLGEPNGGYYHQDTNYTYLLTAKPSANWVLTFLCGDEGRVEAVFIRKSCCSISHQVLLFCLGLI